MYDVRKSCDNVARLLKCDLKEESAKTLTTFKGGGSVSVFYPADEAQFVGAYSALTARGLKPYVLGGGSNTIIADGYVDVPVISVKRLNAIKETDGEIYAESGAYVASVTRFLRENGRCGFEFLSGVPATVGGAARMNAGAFGAKTADYISKIRVLTCDNGKIDISEIDRQDIDFGYRKGLNGIILGVWIRPGSGDEHRSLTLEKEYRAARKCKQPRQPSCGSVFKNGAQPSGKLIEACGLKGKRIGGAQISELHCNFIVNIGGASARDFMDLAELAKKSVYDKFGATLENEFVYLSGNNE